MRVALFYFFYLATNGIMLPFFTQYLRALKFSGSDISLVSAVAPVLVALASPAWGFLADKTGRHARILKYASAGTALALLPLYMATSYAGILAAWTLYAFFVSAILPLADTVAVNEARRIGTDFSRLRLWGSISFIAAAFAFGQYLEAGGGIARVPLAMLGCAVLGALSAHVLKQPAHVAHRIPPSFKDARRLAAQPALLWFLVAGMVHQAGLAPYYLFYSIHVQSIGLSQGIVSWSFGLGVGAEVLMFYFFKAVLKRLPLFPIMGAAFIFSALRWLLTAYVSNGPLLALLQMAHAFSFAVVYAGSISHLEQTVAEPLRTTGRALFSAIAQGLGSVLGYFLAGYIFDRYGSAASFKVAAALDVLALGPLWVAARYAAAKSEQSETLASRDLDQEYIADE